MVATAVPAVIAALSLTAAVVERHDIEGNAAAMRAEAARLGVAIRDGSVPRSSLPAHLDGLITLPNVESATVVDRDGHVLAQAPSGGDEDGIEDGPVRAAIDTGEGTTEVEEARGGIEHVQPIPGQRLALAVDYDLAGVEATVARLRMRIALIAFVALTAMMLVFWFAGGRRLRAMHLDAVARATQDPLTGLGNHRGFHDELRRAVAVAGRRAEPLSLLCLDLDGFKLANDRHGHRHGDELLQFVAGALQAGRAAPRLLARSWPVLLLQVPSLSLRPC